MSRKRQLVNTEYAKFSVALDTSQIIDPYNDRRSIFQKYGGKKYGGVSMGLLQPFCNC